MASETTGLLSNGHGKAAAINDSGDLVDLNAPPPVSTPLELLAEHKDGKRTVGAFALCMMVYFMTCGGPFGIETAVGSGGPLLTMIGCIVIQALWSFPQALMGAELSLMFNTNGGPVVLVSKAFGPVMGFINSYANAACSLVSQYLPLTIWVGGLSLLTFESANLVVLFVQYLPLTIVSGGWEDWTIRLVFCVVTTLINIWGVSWISRMSLLFILLMFSPFVGALGLLILDHNVKFSTLWVIPEFQQIEWSVLISTCIWSNGGFDFVGALAGEVKGGQKTFLIGVLAAFPLVLVNYLIPVILCYLALPFWQYWQPGYFVPVAYKMNVWLGRWMAFASSVSIFGQLGRWMAFASSVSIFGQFSAGLAPTARIIWAMANGTDGSPQYLPRILGWSWQRYTGTIRPIGAIIFCGVITAAMSALPFVFLIQLYLIIRLSNLFSEYAALIYLRYKEPDRSRPWKVPFGHFGAWMLVIPSAIIATVWIYTTPWQVLVSGGGAMVVICIMAGFYGAYIHYWASEESRRDMGLIQ